MAKPRPVRDSVVVITGASSGIGRAVAMQIAQKGGTVVLASRQAEELDRLAGRCRRLGGTALAIPTDVSRQEQVLHLCQTAIENFGRIDCWINNAAVTCFSRFETTPPQAIRRVIETNLYGCIYGAKAVLPYFREQGYGTLMNVSSIIGKIGSPYVSIYSTTKFAIAGFTESLRMEFKDEPDIHIVGVFPPAVDTPLFQHGANYTGRAVKALDPVYSVQRMAKAIVRAIARPKREVMIGSTPRQLLALRKIAPPLGERYMARTVESNHFKDGSADESEGNLYRPDPSHNTMSGGWRQPSDGKAAKIVGVAALGAGIGTLAWLWARSTRRDGVPQRRRIERAPVGRFMGREQPEIMGITGT